MDAAPHQRRFISAPLAFLAAAFAGGILITQAITIRFSFSILVSVLLSLPAVVSIIVNRGRVNLLLTIAASTALGFSFALLELQAIPADSLKRMITQSVIEINDPVKITGVVDRAPEVAPDGLRVALRVERVVSMGMDTRASGIVLLFIPASTNSHSVDIRYGARIRVITKLNRSDNFRNPGVSSFTEYLDRNGYDATAVVKGSSLIERLDNNQTFLLLAWLYEWRQELEARINSTFTKRTAGVLDAALLGNRYGLARDDAERFRDGGTFHVLVISGMHISFIGGVVFLIASWATKRKVFQALPAIVVLWGYSVAVGLGASVVRAAFMFTFVMLAPIAGRRASSVNALGASALVLLVISPSDLFDPSFQLTFLSVAAIVLIAWPLLQRMKAIGSWRPSRKSPFPPSCGAALLTLSEVLFWSERKWKAELKRSNYSYKLFKAQLAGTLERYRVQWLLRFSFAAIVVSVSVQLTLLPLLIVYFHRVSVASIVLNIGVSALMAIVSVAALFALLVAELSSTLAAPFIALAERLDWVMVHSVDPFAHLHLASVRVPEYSGPASLLYVVYYVPLSMLAKCLSSWQPMAHPGSKTIPKGWLQLNLIIGLVFIVVLVLHPFSAQENRSKLRVDFLDVGQGDAALVTMPDGTKLLIDGGGRPSFGKSETDDEFQPDTRSIGEAVVSEYLWNRGIDSVDYILATHADADHIDGLSAVARNFRVRSALVARTPQDDPEYLKFKQTMESQNVPITLIGAGDTLQFGGVTAKVLWPPANVALDAPSGNNDSIVLHFQYGQRTFLFTGDIERPGELSLLRTGDALNTDVIKVAHHGSKTSSIEAFVLASCSRWAIISVGQTSMFGHPNAVVVERWKASGAEVLTTGKSGTITVTTDGKDLRLETFVH